MMMMMNGREMPKKDYRFDNGVILNAENPALIKKIPCNFVANVLKGIGSTSVNKEKFIGAISKHDFNRLKQIAIPEMPKENSNFNDGKFLNVETLSLIEKEPYNFVANVLKRISLNGITIVNIEKFIGGTSNSFNQQMSKPVNKIQEILTLTCELVTSVKLAIDFLSIFQNMPAQKTVVGKCIWAMKIGIDLMRIMCHFNKKHFVSKDNEGYEQNPLNHDGITFGLELVYSILTVLEIGIYACQQCAKDGAEKNDKGPDRPNGESSAPGSDCKPGDQGNKGPPGENGKPGGAGTKEPNSDVGKTKPKACNQFRVDFSKYAQKKVIGKWILAIKIGIDLMQIMYRLYKRHFVSEDNEGDGQNPLNHDGITFGLELVYSILTVLEIGIYAHQQCAKDSAERNDKGPDRPNGESGAPGGDCKPGDQGNKGPPGENGKPGDTGAKGPNNNAGKTTPKVDGPGSAGGAGRQGSPGEGVAPGPPGTNGRAGKQGDPESCSHCPPARLTPEY